MKTKGFTLIELLVVIVIIGILVAIALPNFIKIKDKAKEAEVKQNLHSIQLAVERYATDMSGNYPYFLFGGDPLINIGTSNNIFGAGMAYFTASWYLPFDAFAFAPDTAWNYNDGTPANVLAGDVEQGWGDTLQYEAYMTKYPRNPFMVGDAAKQFSWEYLDSSNVQDYAGWGGHDGDLMFNIGPWGELPQMIRIDIGGAEEVFLDMPGQFYYHPRWADAVTNYGHNTAQANFTGGLVALDYFTVPLNDSAEVGSLDVIGYDLAAVGAARTKGQDIDNAVALFGADKFRTGYFTLGQERNPFVEAGDYGSNGDYEERPFSDGRPDFFIIHLSSGIDRKIQDFSREG